MPLVRQFAFLTAGCPKNEGAHNCGAVARSLFGSVCITCAAWPPCHKVGTLVHVGGDFARDASRARVGRSAFKKGWISRAVAMPHSSCIHRALLPSGPPDGVRQCSLEGSASGPLPPAISPLESSRSRGCCRSCLLLVVVRGAQPCGGRSSSTIARLQGFSSCSPAATPHRWSSRGMTTSLVVERSEPGCGLPLPLASRMFIIRAGEEGEPSWGPAFRMGWRPASSSSVRGRRAFASLAEEVNFGYAGPADCRCRRPPRAWFPSLDGLNVASDAASCRLVGAWLSIHRTSDGRAVRRFATSTASPAPVAAPRGRTRRRTLRGRHLRSWMVLSSLPQ
jgi:hypothetical protein